MLKEKRESGDDLYQGWMFGVEPIVELADIAVSGGDVGEFVHDRRFLLRRVVHQEERCREYDRQDAILRVSEQF